jgi:hypothetical protein
MRARTTGGLLVALVFLFACAVLGASRPKLALTFEDTSLDAGVVLLRQTVCRAFWLRNQGKREVSISLKTSPQLEARASSYRLRPGDTGSVVATLKPREQAGRIWAAISVYTNDPAQPRIDLSLTGEAKTLSEIRPVIKFEEVNFDFGRIRQGKWVEHVFHFRNDGGTDLELLQAHSSCGCTVADFTKVVAPGKWGEVRVTFDSQGKRGYQIHTVMISSNDLEQPLVSLTLRGDVVETILHDPEILFFRTIAPAERYVGKIRVWHADKEIIRIGKVTPSSPSLKVGAITPSEGGRVWEIEVIVGPGLPLGRFYERLEIEVLDREAYYLQVTVNGNIAARPPPAQ